jgi:proteasome accessory factor B
VVGWDRDRQAPRTFRVDRIEGPPEADEPGSAHPPEDFDADAAFSLDPWQFGSGEEIDVDVLVDRAESARALAEVGEAAVVERRSDGSVVLRLAVTDTEALVHWVLDFLDHAEILAPPGLRAGIVERLEAFVAAAR